VTRAALVVVAAGAGRRLGGPARKALVPLAGEPLVAHALRALLRLPWLDPVVLVGHPEDSAALRAVLERLPRPVRLVDGGARRQDSVRAGLAALAALADGEDDGIVLVHDAARPFVPLDALPALVADTIKSVDAGTPPVISATLPRERLWAAQTPQAFRREALATLLSEAEARGVSVTDEAALYEAAGRDVACVTGSRLNFKVTTADDLRLAEAFVGRLPGRED
jgi:2-C-methyl-D-erythritol 4-phosphate cytidylyltransferase